jgi:Dna[CI] antecedent, DciA
MPNKSKPHKKGSHLLVRTGRDISKPTHSVKDLLSRVTPVFTPISNQRIQQEGWREYLDQRLDRSLAKHVTGVVERDGSLVIFAESAGWCTRVRYAIADIEKEMREKQPNLSSITVRVMPSPSRQEFPRKK